MKTAEITDRELNTLFLKTLDSLTILAMVSCTGSHRIVFFLVYTVRIELLKYNY